MEVSGWPRGYSFCVLPGQLLAFFNVFLNKEFNKHLGGPRTTTRPARARVGPQQRPRRRRQRKVAQTHGPKTKKEN